MQEIRAVVSAELDAVNAVIVEQLRSDVDMVENVGHYIVAGGGKRLRPLLALLSAAALGDVGLNPGMADDRQRVPFTRVVERETLAAAQRATCAP